MNRKPRHPNTYLITWTDVHGQPQAEFAESHEEVAQAVRGLERDKATDIQVGPFHRTAAGLLERAA